ncbi:hypothetical protein AN958_00103 [Leucoagaricus sp. SymC.cos]|nr:hypothetical protein AN958_00103 [Leucoagaricus sp. SymC.cos]
MFTLTLDHPFTLGSKAAEFEWEAFLLGYGAKTCLVATRVDVGWKVSSEDEWDESNKDEEDGDEGDEDEEDGDEGEEDEGDGDEGDEDKGDEDKGDEGELDEN